VTSRKNFVSIFLKIYQLIQMLQWRMEDWAYSQTSHNIATSSIAKMQLQFQVALLNKHLYVKMTVTDDRQTTDRSNYHNLTQHHYTFTEYRDIDRTYSKTWL
jgi:hypothetical protein